ncbi:phosphate/phosphite/phosphonate ABC transporter substrate-binding protein [Vibrio gallaecicus]|uniref:phosphate/phosphite/phosphonate ABC transporter substrate-binding protein n=1 Tax=Vibrio gallaecicus TaxID=552386 RepID=UPI0010C9589C|nr:PhnD/SsuA/transferrin family substrate-binding protein [Vibrio gallaecicus]MDN3616594.1 PhnD/SsuA/transferrin family substrate-binding protein [Vibrio gallaecicus]
MTLILSAVIRITGLVCVTLAPLLLMTSSSYANEEHAIEPQRSSIVLGVISSKPKKAFKRSQQLADYLADHLQDYGITSGEVKVAKNLDQMKELFRTGQVDLISETSFSAYELKEAKLADMIARQWKGGSKEYYSIFFTRKDRGINSFDDLLGQIIVFEDHRSTSSFLIPAITLLESGYELHKVSSPRDNVPPGSIGFFFSDEVSRYGDETNMMSWVHNKIVAASVFSNLDWVEEVPNNIKSQLVIFHKSQPQPRAIMLTRSKLNEDLKKAIMLTLFNAHSNTTGKQALMAFKSTSKFDVLTPQDRNSIDQLGSKLELITPLVSHTSSSKQK